jgi:YegS/Rv2252/BmrU family lipid kinase
MQRKIIYIINPISGTSEKKKLQRFIESKTEQEKIPFSVYPSVANGDYSFLKPLIKKENITDIVIAGGDGTVSQVVGSLLDHDVNFGIIPSGSGNGLAYAAKIPKQTNKAIDIIFQGKAIAIDGFYISDPVRPGTGRHFACMLSGLGFDAKIAHDFAQQSKRGLATYIKQVVRNFISAKTYSFTLQLSKLKVETEAFFISIANSNQFGNNFTIAPKASLHDGLLDVVIVTKQNKLSMVLQMLRQLAGRIPLQIDSAIEKGKAIIYFQTERFTIFNNSHAPLHIDGEPAETPEKIEIEIKKKCFRLIQP